MKPEISQARNTARHRNHPEIAHVLCGK